MENLGRMTRREFMNLASRVAAFATLVPACAGLQRWDGFDPYDDKAFYESVYPGRWQGSPWGWGT